MSKASHILIILHSIVIHLPSDEQCGCSIPWRWHIDSSCIFLRECYGQIAALAGESSVNGHIPRINEFLIIIIGAIVDFANVDYHKIDEEVLPQHEESPVILLNVPQALFVDVRNIIPELLIVV